MIKALRILGWIYVAFALLLVVIGVFAVSAFDNVFDTGQFWTSIVSVAAGAIGALVAALMALAMARILENTQSLRDSAAALLSDTGLLLDRIEGRPGLPGA